MTALRLPQPILTRKNACAIGAYDPQVPSDGLTLDTPAGPVDLVAIERALAGQPVPTTKADRRHAVTLLPDWQQEPMRRLADALGITPGAVQRAYTRHLENTRQETASA